MDEGNYFENIRKVGTTLDEGIAKLEETWKIPSLLLCKDNEEYQLTAKDFVNSLKNELLLLREAVKEDQTKISTLRLTHSQFLEESTKAIKSLKEEVDEIKVLFLENGYIDDPAETDLSILTNQLKCLSFNNNKSMVTNFAITESSINSEEKNYNSPTIMESSQSTNSYTPSTFNNLAKQTLMDKKPVGPMYSPYYYKMMNKEK